MAQVSAITLCLTVSVLPHGPSRSASNTVLLSTAYETAGGGAAETEFLSMPGFDGIGNPPTYDSDSRSDTGTMQPQAPWDSPLVHGKTYVIEYDLRTYLDAPPGNTPASYDFLQTLQGTQDLMLHDFCSAAIRGHGLYILDSKASTFVNSAPHSNNNGTIAVWAAVQTAVQTAALLKRDDTLLAAEVAVFADDISSVRLIMTFNCLPLLELTVYF